MFKQKSDSSGTAKVEAADVVQQARTRARHRLIGAVVLLAIGIIGFPLVFETQPRPIPIDIPIEIPRRDAMPPLVMPAARPATPAPAAVPSEPPAPATSAPSARVAIVPSVVAAPSAAAAASSRPAKRPENIITESRTEAGRDVTPPRVAASNAPAPAPAASGDGERALALLEGRPEAASEAQRFVVQVGAFADADAARETRKQVERIGLKTYTQLAQTAAGNRIRVRIGPFATRGEAEAALAKAKAAGLAAVVLPL